jgi:hypothetical protein
MTFPEWAADIQNTFEVTMDDDEGPSTSYRRSFPEGRDGPVIRDEQEEDDVVFGDQSSEALMQERQRHGL